MDSSTGSRYTRDIRSTTRPTVRFYDVTSVLRPENYTPAGLPRPIRSRSPVYNIRRSGSVPTSLTSTGSTPVTPSSAASTTRVESTEEKEANPVTENITENISAPSNLDDPSSTGLSSDIARIRLTSVDNRPNSVETNATDDQVIEEAPKTSPRDVPKTSPKDTSPGQVVSPSDYADAQTFIADNAGELWSVEQENEAIDEGEGDTELSQKSHVFQTSGRFHIDDSTTDSNADSQPFPNPTQVSTGFQPNSSQSTVESAKLPCPVPQETDCKTENNVSSESETQPFDSQTYHSVPDNLGSTSNSNQNSNVHADASSGSSHDSTSGSTNTTLSQHTSTTQSSSTPTRSQPSPVMPSEFESPFAAQRRNAAIITEPNSPRQGLPRVPLSPARVKRVKQENRTYTVKKIGDYVQNIYNFVETRSFENRTLHLSRESQQYREKGG